ncbi:hypothetical protein ACN4EG_20645 [Alkalinema pantanalense CENA528]|uniref:hypothetical protein n=1 Tax=Alkalinema pantanalense TaxID=1620705 RepID=UPI003D6F78D4
MELKLTQGEMKEIQKIAANSEQSIESLCDRLEKLTWRDGLLEFRMLSGGEMPLWVSQLQRLSQQVNQRLEQEGIPIGPSLAAYQAWNQPKKKH